RIKVTPQQTVAGELEPGPASPVAHPVQRDRQDQVGAAALDVEGTAGGQEAVEKLSLHGEVQHFLAHAYLQEPKRGIGGLGCISAACDVNVLRLSPVVEIVAPGGNVAWIPEPRAGTPRRPSMSIGCAASRYPFRTCLAWYDWLAEKAGWRGSADADGEHGTQ